MTSPLVSGDDVREVQHKHAALGYATGVPDGIYGPRTAAAVQAFQRDHSLAIDGVVGPRTRSALAASP